MACHENCFCKIENSRGESLDDSIKYEWMEVLQSRLCTVSANRPGHPARGVWGRHPLLYAIGWGHLSVVFLLLEFKAEVDELPQRREISTSDILYPQSVLHDCINSPKWSEPRDTIFIWLVRCGAHMDLFRHLGHEHLGGKYMDDRQTANCRETISSMVKHLFPFPLSLPLSHTRFSPFPLLNPNNPPFPSIPLVFVVYMWKTVPGQNQV